MSKLITYVGYSRVNNELKFRTATDEKRIHQLEVLGDTHVNMTALPTDMTKSDAAKWALTASFFAKAPEEVFALFAAKAKDENPFAKTAKKTVKVKSTKKTPVAVTSSNEVKMTPKEAEQIRAEFNRKVKEAYEAN